GRQRLGSRSRRHGAVARDARPDPGPLSSLEQALAGRLSEWEGLDPGLTEESLGAALGPAYDTWPRQPARLAGQFVTNPEGSRGGALAVGRPFDTAPSFPECEPRIAVAQLFEPTDLQGFIVRYGGNDRPGPSHPLP